MASVLINAHSFRDAFGLSSGMTFFSLFSRRIFSLFSHVRSDMKQLRSSIHTKNLAKYSIHISS